jgi:lambda repressor-like predicted transcriptional regulator
MENHYGQIVEYTIRKKGYSIADLARLANVNRRSVYNWFNQKHLKIEIIYRVGVVLKHDFSVEFPELFTPSDFEGIKEVKQPISDDPIFWELPSHHVWKDRYISLLENYNKLLLDVVQINTNNDSFFASGPSNLNSTDA